MSSDQATVLPSVLHIIRDVLVDEGFGSHVIRITEDELFVQHRIGEWTFATSNQWGLWIWPFKTNMGEIANPAYPEFIEQIRTACKLPVKHSFPYGHIW